METAAFKWLIIANTIIGFGAGASAQDIDIGKAEYQSSCAACHGVDAKGGGPLSKNLKTSPADLTILAKKNTGVFPVNTVYKVIDGRNSISSHGTREMPIWGYQFTPPQAFSLERVDDYIYSPRASTEGVVYGHIMAIIDYLVRIQEKVVQDCKASVADC